MATSPGWAKLGAVLGGGGIDRQGAFEEGRLRTAQTESALAQARERQIKAMTDEAQYKAREAARTSMAKAGIPEHLQDVTLGGLGSDFAAAMQGGLRQQEIGLRDVLADPNAELGDQFAAGQGVKGEVLPRYNVTGGVAEDLFSRDAPLAPTPVGEAQISAATALADQRQRAPAGGGGTGPDNIKVPTGFAPNPDYNPNLPIGEGNYPLIKATPPETGSREHQMNQRMARSAAQIVPDIANLLTMPASASLGVLGTGSAPGASMLQASVDALRNTVAPAVVRAYTAQTGEIGKAMAFIESNGFVPNQALLDQAINAYSIRPGDTGFDVLRKFANLRQNIEQFNLVQQADERVPADIRKLLAELTAVTARSVPFTVQQVNELQFGANRTRTMADLMREHGFNPEIGTTPGGGQPGARSGAPAPTSAPAPATDEVWERGPDGKLRRATATGAQ